MSEMILLFLFIFSILTMGKFIIVFLQHLLSNPPKRLVLNDKNKLELIAAMSYFFTYIIN